MTKKSDRQSVAPLQLPPHSIEAEQAVLGGLMLVPDSWDRIADRLRDSDFYRRDHQLIYRAIGELAGNGKPCDAVTLGEWFEQQGIAELVGGSRYVMELANSTPSAANINAYADIVREKALLRQLIDSGSEIAGDAFRPEGRAIDELVALAEQRIFRIAERGKRALTNAVGMREAIKQAFQRIQERFDNQHTLIGLPTGLVDLDAMTLGLRPQQLIIIAGRPSMGKSGLALGIARDAALRSGKAVAIFSMEMSQSEVTDRLLSMTARIDLQRLQKGEIHDDEWPRLTASTTLLLEAKIVIDDTGAIEPLELRARARRLKRSHDLGLIVVDYLQLMSVPGTKENRATEIAEISRGLKALAKELDIPVIALSQLNRALESRPDKRPMMSDLRESGGIEQDADLIAFVYRDEYYHPETESKGIAELILAKQRNGPTGVVKLAFLAPYAKFESYSSHEYVGGV